MMVVELKILFLAELLLAFLKCKGWFYLGLVLIQA